MKKILLLTFSLYDMNIYDKVLREFLGQEIELVKETIIPCVRQVDEEIDLALLTDSTLYHLVKQWVKPGTPIVWIKHSVSTEVYGRLMEMAGRGEKASIIADTAYYAEHRKNMLINLGVPAEALEIWHSHSPMDQVQHTVLVFEESSLVEEEGREYIHFNGRGLVSPETLIQIAAVMGRLDLLQSHFFEEYCRHVRYATRQVSDLIEQGSFYAIQQNKVVGGFIVFEPGGLIGYCNYCAAAILGKSESQLTGKPLVEVFPFMEKWMNRLDDFGERVIKFHGLELVFDLWRNETHGAHVGYIMISNYNEEQKKELRLRTQMMKQQYCAKNTFDSIYGESEAIERCRQTARKFANSTANVLITGATGTGKGLFANAIHSASKRRKGPFVAVNCGALTESLLESELFGYEGGAFTGARREGKAGLFEMAHMGTIFLDEIEAMPLGFQVKLLRMLQEREVVRVGGSSVIPVDVRVIAATNQELEQLIAKGAFREDLYYRLNVLPLYLPALNERSEDILPLFYKMRDEEIMNYGSGGGGGGYFELDRQAERCLQHHFYKGNIRELKNCVEYLGSLEQMKISYDDLPIYMKKGDTCPVPRRTLKQPSEAGESGSRGWEENSQLVISAIQQLKKEGKAAGRRSIAQRLKASGSPMSEMQVRIILKQLEIDGQIDLNRGRKGIVLRLD